ncbi:MAG: NADH-quinone oxidoreductase subunit NuoF [Oligoflexia bacterium]|nr:NADH-quinone oxidoreductase subunit NuoF [Oligoflexia bacterium]
METKLLTQHYDKPEYQSLKGYQKLGGYEALKKAFSMKPQDIITEVKNAGLRGRGGAGFSTGMKWSFLPNNNEPRYLLCNADEGEPGTFKDRVMMERAPHQLIEGMIISAFAINSKKSYIYIRGEYMAPIKIVEKAIREVYDAGLLGKNILGSGFDHDMDVYRGAGAYIVGEETGLISSLEGKKGQPKLKPPFPAVQGYLKKPTIVNNVETLATVPWIITNGASEYKKYGTEKSPGTKLFSVSGNINKPGVYEVPLGIPFKDFLQNECGGMKPGYELKALIPGGSSCPVLTRDEALKSTMDYECMSQLGSMLGSGGVIIIDDKQCMVDLLNILMNFYHHESCGQCTPCREGTGWMNKITTSLLTKNGKLEDISLLHKIASHMLGTTICALSDAAAMPVMSFVTKFRDEFEYYAKEKRSKVKGDVHYAQAHH